MYGADVINKVLDRQLKNMLKARHFPVTLLILPIFPIAISSDKIFVVARLIPDSAIVIAKPYMDITNPYNPTASAPIF